jgi:hypothetical protein
MKFWITIMLLVFSRWACSQSGFQITSDFPGGNIIVEETKADTLLSKP